MLTVPESCKPHEADYTPGSWESYTIEELAMWVVLLTKRASHRLNDVKRAKDLRDAQNYAAFLQTKIDSEIARAN